MKRRKYRNDTVWEGGRSENKMIPFNHSLWRRGWLVPPFWCWALQKLVIDGWLVCGVMFILLLICIFVCICGMVGFCWQGSVPIPTWWIWLPDNTDSLVTGTSSWHLVSMTDGLMLTYRTMRDEIQPHLDLQRRKHAAQSANTPHAL